MITWLLLVSLFSKSTQDRSGKENGVLHCGPQNLTLTSSDQMILLTWEDDPSCSTVRDVLIYQMVVLIAEKQVHYDEVSMTPDQIGSIHSWNWTSHLPLECVSHSVRLSSRYKNLTSPWKQELTLSGIAGKGVPEVFPKDRLFKVGSRATFCCVLPAADIFDRMYLTGYNGSNMNTTMISNHTYALTVQLNQASKGSCTDVKCQSKTSDNGACAYISYPPDDRDLQCETRTLESVECHWKVGRKTHLSIKSPTDYQLLGRPCPHGSKGICSQIVQVDVGERKWTLTAQNKFGMVELQDSADLTKRVHMFAPERVSASTVNARNVSLAWEWTVQQYNTLNMTCHVNVSHGETHTISENVGVGLHFAVVHDLIPNWTYDVKVRCGTTKHFWKWSNWSTSVRFHTRGDVPDALDVWMQTKDNQIIIIWKMLLTKHSHGNISDYEVTWAKTTDRGRQNRSIVAYDSHSLALPLDTSEEYIVTVTARNINGSSTPSTIIVPSIHPGKTRVNTSRISGSSGSFNLSWSASPTASCGYIVDWCPALRYCSVEWLKVPPNETNARIFSKNFKGGLRYSLSLYACTQGAPVLLERREGYVSEERIEDGLFKSLKWKQQNSYVKVSWDPISQREQTAFIQGYVLYCLDYKNNIVINVSTDDPEATSLTARYLDIGTYTFTVKAQTAVGECGTASITATLHSLTDSLIKAVFISLVTVFGLLFLITILCYRHWTCIKQKVCPPIPKPVLTNRWLTSLGENSSHPFRVHQCHHSEADITDAPEIYCNSEALVNGFVSQENVHSAQTPKSYYNQPLEKCIPPPLTLPTKTIPSQSGLPSSPFRSVFPNPSYNLIVHTRDKQSSSGPKLQEGRPLERSSSGYQPQSQTETFINPIKEDPESPMYCVSTYILLPQSRSK